jgi:hypothetical protein
MSNVFYAVFSDPARAEAAMHDITPLDRHGGGCRLQLQHGRLDAETLPLELTDARRGLCNGLLVGALGGSLLGNFALPALGLVMHSAAATALCIAAGTLIGALGGLLQGAGVPDPVLDQLDTALREGGAVLVVDAEDRYHRAQSEAIAISHGAVVLRGRERRRMWHRATALQPER